MKAGIEERMDKLVIVEYVILEGVHSVHTTTQAPPSVCLAFVFASSACR